jgi:hypothetical protein
LIGQTPKSSLHIRNDACALAFPVRCLSKISSKQFFFATRSGSCSVAKSFVFLALRWVLVHVTKETCNFSLHISESLLHGPHALWQHGLKTFKPCVKFLSYVLAKNAHLSLECLSAGYLDVRNASRIGPQVSIQGIKARHQVRAQLTCQICASWTHIGLYACGLKGSG